ncbi:MAG: BMP family protein [Clostridia bacterium]
MKKCLAMLLVLVMVFSTVGCAQPSGSQTAIADPATQESTANPDAETATDSATTQDLSGLKVVALLSGVITDNGWNQICFESVKNLSDKYGTELEYIENIAVSDMAEYIRTYAEEKYDMIIVHGSQFKASAEELAVQYPDSHFCLSYGFRVDENTADQVANIPNLAYVGPVNMGILIGAIMGILTDTNKVVFLGGQDIPAITDIVSGIEEGVRLTNADAEVATAYLGTLTDADLAKERALAYINQGFDVISASANSAQLGCLHAAAEKGVYAMGFNGDQYSVAPDAIVLSVMRNYPSIYEDVFLSIANQTWKSGMVVYDLAQKGTLVSDWHGWDTKLPTEKVKAINEVVAKLYAGELGDY